MVALVGYVVGWLLFLVTYCWLRSTLTERQSNNERITDSRIIPNYLFLVAAGPFVFLLGALNAALPRRHGWVPKVKVLSRFIDVSLIAAIVEACIPIVPSGIINVALVGALSIAAVESASEIHVSEVMQFVSVRNDTEVDLIADEDPPVDAAPILILLATLIQGLSLLVVMIASKNYKHSMIIINKFYARIITVAPYILFVFSWFSVSIIAWRPECYRWWPSYTLTFTSSVPIGVLVIVQGCIIGLSKVSDTIITHVIGAPILLHMVFVSLSLYNFPKVVNFDSEYCLHNSELTVGMGVFNYIITGVMLFVWLVNNPPWNHNNSPEQCIPESTELRECENASPSTQATAGDVEAAEHQEDVLMTNDTLPLTDSRGEDQEQGASRGLPSTTDELAEIHGVGDESSPSSVNEPPAAECQGEDEFMNSDTQSLISSV